MILVAVDVIVLEYNAVLVVCVSGCYVVLVLLWCVSGCYGVLVVAMVC